MKQLIITALLASMALFIGACTDKDQDEPKTLIDSQVKAMDKAKDVEQVLKQADEEQRQQIEEQSK